MAPRSKQQGAELTALPQFLPNNNPGLRVVSVDTSGSDDSTVFYPIVAWAPGESAALDAVTPLGQVSLPIVDGGRAVLLFDHDQRKALLGNEWVKLADVKASLSRDKPAPDVDQADDDAGSQDGAGEASQAE